MVTKTSILIFYLRLSRNTTKLLRIASYATLALVNVAGFVLTFLSVLQCRPVGAVFDSTVTSAQCIPLITLYLASAPVNIITDLAILVLPIPVLTGMRLPQKQKAILVATFGLGIFVTIVDVVRIYYLQQASVDVNGSFASQMGTIGNQKDFAWYASLSLMWSVVEVNIGIICACIPTLKPLITRILPKLIHDGSIIHTTDKSASFVSPDEPATIEQHPEEQHDLPSLPEQAANPPQHSPEGGDYEQELGMMDFLTTPGMDPSNIQRTHTARTHVTDNAVYFGFVNMRRPRSMLKSKGRESFKYCTVVTILFFLWGFSYGLLNTLNSHISEIGNSNSPAQSLGLQSVYFGAYLVGPLAVGQWVLKKGGFKACFITGLCIYGTGTLMFWPSAVLVSFPGFIVSSFVVAMGLSVLETAANPFIALCGPSNYAEMRLLTAQAVQGVGSVFSPLLAEKALFRSVQGASLIDVQWTYLAIALFDVILALFFYYMPLPEASDEDLHLQSLPILPHNNIIPAAAKTHFGKYRIVYITLAVGVTAQFLYVGGQECVSVYFESLLTSLAPNTSDLSLSTFNYFLIGRVTFALGRFLVAALCLIIKPRILLFICFLGALIFSILVFALPNANGTAANTIAGLTLMIFFFQGPLWPIIFAITLRGLGRITKSGAAFLTAAASGGAIVPWAMFGAQNSKSIQYSFCVVIAVLAAGLLFPMYLSIIPAARAQVDPLGRKHDILNEPPEPQHRNESFDSAMYEGNPFGNAKGIRSPAGAAVKESQGSAVKRMGRGLSGILARKKDNRGESAGNGSLPSVEHRERSSWGSGGKSEG
jgi:fucose permease